ncbi:MAG: hypothetical protein QXJ55_08145 [Candidatus Caldarchaeum sp.]
MERPDYEMLGMLFMFMALMLFSSYVPKPWDTAVVVGSYAAMVLYMILMDWALQVRLSKHMALKTIIMPARQEHTLMAESFSVVARHGNTSTVELRLAYPFNDPEGGKTRKVLLYLAGEWEKRFQFRPMYIRFSGRSILHPQAEACFLIRMNGVVERGKLIPDFIVFTTGKDVETYREKVIIASQVMKYEPRTGKTAR